MPSTTSDADYVALTIREIFSDSDPNNRANSLRSLFAETLDFKPDERASTIPLAANDGLPQYAHRIADRNGITVVYIAISDPAKTRVNKSDAIEAAKSIKRTTHDDLFMVFSNGPNDRLEFIWQLQMQDREELRKIVINRDMPELTAPQLIADIYDRTKESGSLHYALRQVFTDDAVEKPVVPENPTDIFLPHLAPLKDIYTELVNEPATQTKQKLWLDMLRGSGCAPESKDEQLEQFISHTLLVTIARAVIATVSDWERSEDPVSIMAEGFASWPQNRNERRPTNVEGVKWTRDVFYTAATRDWRPRTRDVLRNIYEELIPKEQRKAFGEYYTPDWLAGMLAERVIDDEWIERAVERHLYNRDIPTRIGILDPACGSGTFLYHAAQRILKSEALLRQNATPEQQADFIARMINGIDIHPIAVEISRATLMRALPTEPTDGAESLHIYQGDSLIYTHHRTELENTAHHTLPSPVNETLKIPKQWAARSGFGQKVMRFVSAANQGEQMPSDIADGLLKEDRDTLEHTFSTLQEVCRKYGNSVWAWYIFNSVSPATLKERKVDRILSNPPWVVLSNILVKNRREEMERLAKDLEIRAHRGKFDIAALFVKRCRQNYLSNDQPSKAAWVLNRSALTGDNWELSRLDQAEYTSEWLDFSHVRKAPFTGAKSCAWIQTENAGGAIPHRLLQNQSKGDSIDNRDDWEKAQTYVRWQLAPKRFPTSPSAYLGSGNRPLFQSGFKLEPYCLVKIAEYESEGEITHIVTAPSRHEPWKSEGIQRGQIPSRWVRDIVNSAVLYPFNCDVIKGVIPLTDTGSPDSERENNGYWRKAEAIYARHLTGNPATPGTLFGRLNFQNKLMQQIYQEQTSDKTKVVYNKSGQELRAGRLPPPPPPPPKL